MAVIKRTGTAVWSGGLREGDGTFRTQSGVLRDQSYTFATRFGDEQGTNPDELIAAAHASCYSMAFANVLAQKGYQVDGVETTATVHVVSQEGGGFAIEKSELHVRGRVPDIDLETFRRLAEQADGECPVSNLLRPGLEIELEVSLA